MPTSLHSHLLLERFQALDRFLTEHQALWKPRPFTHLHLDWESTLRISEHRDRPFRLIVTAHFANA
ncbi:hypothetical protein [Pseudomonas sp. LP_4_YM]|uniref:hypothetical protein n=1 Tax=Pseudomonas sp. LP_4_YM TaxID=2485135 RepID=UPI0035578748